MKTSGRAFRLFRRVLVPERMVCLLGRTVLVLGWTFSALSWTALASGCSTGGDSRTAAKEGWPASSPRKEGMDPAKLRKAEAFIREGGYPVHSMTVVKNGRLVLDIAFPPYTTGSKHVIHSCTKSILSLLIGIALDKGCIESLEAPVLELFSDREIENRDPRKESMTLKHLLTMSAGLDTQDSYLYRWRGLEAMGATEDWVQYVLNLPMAAEPGKTFEYSNCVSYLLSAILQRATGKTALEFAGEHLFGPLGITDVDWPSSPQGISTGWGRLEMKPLDMAKIGWLVLKRGQWQGRRIVSAAWVEESTRRRIRGTLAEGYGCHWWIDERGTVMALGYAGQYICILAQHDLVVVFTSQLPEEDFYVPMGILYSYIVPAVKG